jgi:hypothetical protein
MSLGSVIGGKHYFSAEAVSADTAIAQYPCSRIRMSATSDSMIAKELCEMVRQETSRLQTLILGGITAEEKVGAFLVNLAEGGASWPVSLPISRYDIADFLAISVGAPGVIKVDNRLTISVTMTTRTSTAMVLTRRVVSSR